MHREIWLAKLFNDYLPGVGNAFLSLAGQPAQPRPWSGYIVMQLLVALIIVVLFAMLRPRLGYLLLLQPVGFSGTGLRQIPGAFRGSHAVSGAADDSHRPDQPHGAAAVAHRSSLCQHVRRRAGDAGVPRPDLLRGTRRIH